ncbi:MAG: TonB-dependent receptor [Porticoccaceae bacterium]
MRFAKSAGAVLVLAPLSIPVLTWAQDQDAGENARALETIIVTGTRRAERTVIDSSVPVDVVGSGDLGTVSSHDLNNKLASLVPSFNVQRTPGFDGGNFVRPATLRGLSPDQTLVLINGKRRHRSAYIQISDFGAQATDLSEIPQIAIRHVEVLRDGASAQYGSEAIAGVINLLLEDRPGGELSVQTGQFFDGDGESVQVAGRLGSHFGEGGLINLSLEHNDSDPTNRSTRRNPSGLPDLNSTRAFVNFTYELDNAEIYGFGNYGHSRGSYIFGWRDPSGALFDRSYYQDNEPFLYPDYNLADRYPDGFNPRFKSTTDDGSLVGGLRGERGPISWDFSGRVARNQIEYSVANSINASLGPLSPTSFDAGEWIQSEQGVNADFGYLWDLGLATPVNVSFGGEWRREVFELKAGELASYAVGPFSDQVPGSNSYPGPSPAQAGEWDRESHAVYVDIDTDVTDRFNFGVAGRYENFSDFGDTWNFKISGRYGLTDWLNLRAAASTGFHAPSPGQQNLTKTTQGPDPLIRPPLPQVIRTYGLIPSTNPVAVAAGGKALDAEEAVNFSVGLVASPTSDLTLSLDYYHIEIDDRLGITANQALTPEQRQSLLNDGVAEAENLDEFRFFINGYDTRTEGIDLVATWRKEVGPGQLGVIGVFNHNRSRITGGDPRVVTPHLEAEIEDRRPRNVGILTTTYDVGAFHFLSRVRYYSAWTDAVEFLPTELHQRIGSEVFVDLAATWALQSGLSITVGADNVFDSYPDDSGPVLTDIGVPYPMLRPYEIEGGHYYLRVSQQF